MQVVLAAILAEARLRPARRPAEPICRRSLTFAPAQDALVVPNTRRAAGAASEAHTSSGKNGSQVGMCNPIIYGGPCWTKDPAGLPLWGFASLPRHPNPA